MVRSRMLCQDVNAAAAGLDTTFHPVDDAGDHPRSLRSTSHEKRRLRRLPRVDGLDRLRLRELRRLGAPPHHRQRLAVDSSGTIYSDPQGKDVTLSGLSGHGQPGRLPGRAATTSTAACCATGPTTRTARAPGARTPAPTTPSTTKRRRNSFGLKSIADGDHPRPELHAARAGQVGETTMRMLSRRQFAGSVGAGLLLAPVHQHGDCAGRRRPPPSSRSASCCSARWGPTRRSGRRPESRARASPPGAR